MELIMTGIASASDDAHALLSEQSQAAALWTYVHLKLPRFNSATALDVVRRLSPSVGEDPKGLAKRLRRELIARGVALKHTAALEAAARLLGHETWHSANREARPARLQLTTLDDAGEQRFEDWRSLVPGLLASCESARQQTGTCVFDLHIGPSHLMVSFQVPRPAGSTDTAQSVPLLTVSPIGEDAEWLSGAPGALEALRRQLEETGKAMLDGFAVLQFCNERRMYPGLLDPVRPGDASNSELVLLREDNELEPGFEIARGDELNCWSEFELACERPDPEVTLDSHAWLAAGGRYVWRLSTLRPAEYIPGLRMHELGEQKSAQLLHRYKLAKRLFAARLRHRQTKSLEYLATLEEDCRVDLHRVLRELKTAGYSWESYCAEVDDERPLEPKLPVGFVFTLMERLRLVDPNVLIARPNRSELCIVNDDSLLRALMPRVDHVRYRLPAGVREETQVAVREAVQDFAGSMRVWKMTAAGAIKSDGDPFPYLVYANDGEELRGRLADLGLQTYAGVMLHLFSTADLPQPLQVAGGWPFAIGHSLFLDIDFTGNAP
jgi:hypothetical protein